MKDTICRCCGGSIIAPSADNPNVCVECGKIGAGDDAALQSPNITILDQSARGETKRPNAGDEKPGGDPH